MSWFVGELLYGGVGMQAFGAYAHKKFSCVGVAVDAVCVTDKKFALSAIDGLGLFLFSYFYLSCRHRSFV